MADARDPKLSIDYAQAIRDSDELHNINCYEYLRNLFNALPDISSSRFHALKDFYDDFFPHKDYDARYPYGDLYSRFLRTFEDEMLLNENPQFEDMLADAKDLILALYINNNQSLERTGAMIEPYSGNDKAIKNKLKSSTDTSVNKSNPSRTGSSYGIARAYSGALFSTYKPQDTSLPAIRTYSYKAIGWHPTELRFGTQGQYESRMPRVSPLFHAWLLVQARNRNNLTSAAAAAEPASSSVSLPVDSSESLPITHVYINNLRLDSAGNVDSIKDIEIPLSRVLHKLEQYHPNIAVITLPADKGLMSKNMLAQHEKKYSYNVAFDWMLGVAMGRSHEKIQDFCISDNVKKILYGMDSKGSYSRENERINLEPLLTNSFYKLGFDRSSMLSPSQFHAVYFHFIKFELTNFILYSLRPHTFNITCKDAIDRGGVSSAYYNLITSIESGNPMQQEEFIRALHAAPAMVKGRGMNHHIVAIWNAIDAYIDAHPALAESSVHAWLIEWRDNNVPENSKRYFQEEIHKYIVQRSGEDNKSVSLAGIPGEIKLNAANIIEGLSRGLSYPDFKFSEVEWQAIHEGRLGNIVAKMEKQGLIDLSSYAPKGPIIEMYTGLRS